MKYDRIRERLNVSVPEDIVAADDANYYEAVDRERASCKMRKQVVRRGRNICNITNHFSSYHSITINHIS